MSRGDGQRFVIRTRHLVRLCGDLVAYAKQSGRWWVPALIVALGIATVLALTAQTIVTPVIYALF